MIDHREERINHEDMDSFNPRRVQDGGYMDRARNRIAAGLVGNRNR
jgi:hypothetical protein